MDLVGDQVAQLHEVGVAHGHFLVHGLAGAAVVEGHLAQLGFQAGGAEVSVFLLVVFLGLLLGFLEQSLDVLFRGAVEDRGRGDQAEHAAGPAQVGFHDLAHVHTGRHAQGVQDDVDRSAVFHEGHIFLGQDLGHDALVAVTAGHLVAHLQLLLDGDVDPDHLQHVAVHVVAALDGVDFAGVLGRQDLVVVFVFVNQLVEFAGEVFVLNV